MTELPAPPPANQELAPRFAGQPWLRRWWSRREWLLLALILLALVFWLSGPRQLQRSNGLIQDTIAWLHQQPASSDIVIVAVDDASIAAIGRWPWRRALHAQVLEQISRGQPRAIGVDVMFSEEDLDYPGDDVLLARAMARSGRVVLPVTRNGLGVVGDAGAVTTPLAPFAQAAAALGHTQLPMDADGVVRGFYGVEGPLATPRWHMALSMHCIGAAGAACQPPENSPAAPADDVLESSPRAGKPVSPWVRREHEIIAFASAPAGRSAGEPFTSYSYIDVLRDQIPAAAFKGKYVLLGATASGLGEKFTVPLGSNARAISNVEMLAHILNGSLQGSHLAPASPALNRSLNMALVLAGLLALAWVGPSGGLLACMLLGLFSLLLTGLMPRIAHIQLAPAAALLGLVLAYPLWSWLRLRAATKFLALELRDLQTSGHASHNLTISALSGDLLDQRIAAVEQASRQLRALHHFVSESLRQLPSATFVCDQRGTVLLANAAANAYALSLGQSITPGLSLPQLLHQLRPGEDAGTYGQRDTGGLQAPLLTEQALLQARQPASGEGRDAQGRSLMLLAQPFKAEPTTGWLITLVDISDMRTAQAQRDQAMQFISHDIRAPVASIITLLQMQAAGGPNADQSALLPRIESYARSSLQLADDFVHLARAQQQVPRMEPVELGLLADQAVNDCWAQATAQQVQLEFELPEQEAMVLGDSGMLQRCIVNLIGNAIKYGKPADHAQNANASVECFISEDEQHWHLNIRDHGPGMDSEAVQRLSRPFERLEQHRHVDGVGLGLAFVRTAVERHGGQLQITSQPGEGSTFTLVLPKLSA